MEMMNERSQKESYSFQNCLYCSSTVTIASHPAQKLVVHNRDFDNHQDQV